MATLRGDFGGVTKVATFVPNRALRGDFGGTTKIARPPSPPRTVLRRLDGEMVAITRRRYVYGELYPPV